MHTHVHAHTRAGFLCVTYKHSAAPFTKFVHPSSEVPVLISIYPSGCSGLTLLKVELGRCGF